MRKLFLLCAALLVVFSLAGCKNNDDIKSTEIPVTEIPTVLPIETKEPIITNDPVDGTYVPVDETEAPVTEAPAENSEIPLDFQKEGWISVDESITLLKMYLGSYDDSGNEFIFGHESTVLKDGKYFYNFKITTLIISDTGLAHQSYYANYLVSTDGMDIVEYTIE